MIHQEMGENFHTAGSNPADKDVQSKRKEGFAMQHARAADPLARQLAREMDPLKRQLAREMDPLTRQHERVFQEHARAMDPEVNPLDGALLPLSPALAYIQQRVLPRILRNPFARPFLRPVDAVKEGIFPDYYQVVTRPMCLGTVEKRLTAGWYWDAQHCIRDIQQVWINAKLYNLSSHPVHQWAVKLEMLVSTWLRRLPSEVGRDLRLAVEERNLRACSNILLEIRRNQTLFLADQLGLPDLERRLALGEFQSAEQLAGRFRVLVGRAYREGKLDCNLVSDLHHSFEVEFANRVYAWEDVPVEEEDDEDDDILEEEEVEHRRLLSLLSMSRRIESELGSLTMERRWNGHSEEEPEEGAISDESMGEEENYSRGSILENSRAFSDESMEEDGRVGENYSGGSSSNHFVKIFQNIGICGNHQLEAEL